MKKLKFIIEKTGIPFHKDGKFWVYDGKWFDPEKVYTMVSERIDKGWDVRIPNNMEDRHYYLKSFGPMC